MRLVPAIALVAAAVAVFAMAAGSHPANHVRGLPTIFAEAPLDGGQVPPRLYKWVNDDVSVFFQLDSTTDPSTVRYLGISVKGTFCAEAQPGGANGGFTHYHRVTAPLYAQGHGGAPGENRGYWLLWVATDTFTSGGRKIPPGVDYQFSPTPPPTCGANVPQPTFQGPGQHKLTRAEIKKLALFYNDKPFKGGQTAPRFYRWMSGDVLAFLEFDNPDPAKATGLRYIGVAQRGTFCKEQQPTPDFTSFQRTSALDWAVGKGGKIRQGGFWHLAVAVDKFAMPWGAVTPGVDRKFSVTTAPTCGT